ncbi:MAG: hypothetical protein ABJ256_15870 [Nisaea sp.]|uniref:hypothetical protein n=1 Tax=Alphaproteobacteria TaxID=28211 RepID=UPI003262E49C
MGQRIQGLGAVSGPVEHMPEIIREEQGGFLHGSRFPKSRRCLVAQVNALDRRSSDRQAILAHQAQARNI